MVSFLLDTNVLSELRRGARADARVVAWAGSVDPMLFHTSVIVIGELRRGVEMARRRDVVFGERLDAWLREVVLILGNRVLSVDLAVATLWGRITAEGGAFAIDSLIAATALRHDLILVTRNVKDMTRFAPAAILNPFEFEH